MFAMETLELDFYSYQKCLPLTFIDDIKRYSNNCQLFDISLEAPF